MQDLPNPLSRAELYLAKASGMEVAIPMPASREELYLSCIAGDTSVDDIPAPYSLQEQWLAYICGIEPQNPLAIEGAFHIGNQKVDVRFFAYACGLDVELPEPQNRKEQYFYAIAQNHHIKGVPKTARGVSISLTDVVSGIKSLDYIYGDTYQKSYSGKNLFNSFAATKVSWQSGTLTIKNDGSLELSGNTGSNGYFALTQKLSALCPSLSIGDTVYLYLETTSSAGAKIYIGENWFSGNSKTITQTMLDASVVVYGGYNQTDTIKIMVTKTVDTSYEPYVGGIPSPNPDYPQKVQTVTGEQTVKVTGKNLFDNYQIPYKTGLNFYNLNIGVQIAAGSSQSVTTSATNDSVSMVSTGNWQGVFMLADIEDTKKYTFSAVATGTGLRLSAYTLDDTHTIVRKLAIGSTSGVTFGASFTADSTEKYFAFAFGSSVASTIIVSKPQLELGSTATTYEPYQGNTYTVDLGSIELCKIGDYQDYIYKEGDSWFMHKATAKRVLNGSENWVFSSITPGYTRALLERIGFPIAAGFCDKLTARTGSHGSYEYVWFQPTAIGGLLVQIKTERLTGDTLKAFKTWLEENPVTVVYCLTDPTDTQITNSTLIGQLNALNSAILPKPVANISVVGNLAGEIEITYLAEEV